MTAAKTFICWLPHSFLAAVDRVSKEEGTNVNQFMTTAVTEQVAALGTASNFSEGKTRADFEAFD